MIVVDDNYQLSWILDRLMFEQQFFNDLTLLPEYARILQTIIELDQKLQKEAFQNQQKSVNDVFSVIEKAYWKLYLQENEENLSEHQKRQIYFHLTSKIGKSLDSQLSKTGSQNSQVPKWFVYKGYGKRGQRDQENSSKWEQYGNQEERLHSKSEHNLKNQYSLKMQQRQGTAVDPYHANIKLQAQNGLPQIEVIYRFFSIKSMLKNSTDMLDVEKITILQRKGNSFDRQDQNEVERQKNKFVQKFKLYSELIRCFQYFGYGARIAKKHSKQKVTGVEYQYAVVHISKITFKLLEKYVMNFINKKTKYTHRARLEKITYNMFNLPNFFTPELKLVFIKLIKIVFEVEEPFPIVKKEELQELYNYLVKQIQEKEKNPDKFKNQYMIKLQNPTFYNVRKELREKVKQQAEQRKRLGIRIKGRKSKISKQLNELKISLAEEKQLLDGKHKDFKKQPSQYLLKSESSMKKKHKKVKKEEYLSEEEYQDQFQDEDIVGSDDQVGLEDDQDDDDQQIKQNYYDSDQQSEQIRDYFKRSGLSHRSDSKKKSKKGKNKKDRSKSKSKTVKKSKTHNSIMDNNKNQIYSDSNQSN